VLAAPHAGGATLEDLVGDTYDAVHAFEGMGVCSEAIVRMMARALVIPPRLGWGAR
jgi:hypothetical protein